jgi:3-(3-hydroxy-phenyl)propionate hydroxylase
MRNDQTVLIAGAGPVGLVAANQLADAGIPVRVFEAEPALPQTLRASTFQPPTLDMLAKLGVATPLIEMGRKAPKIQYRDRTGWVAEFDFAMIASRTAFPFRLQCEQFKLTRLLAERLAQFPHARLEFASAVTGVEQDAESVTVHVRNADRECHARGAWLIGADGGRSRVRTALGVQLAGFTWQERYVVISTPFDFSAAIPGLCEASYFADAEEWYFLLHVPQFWRALFPVRPEETDESILSDAEVERRLQRVWNQPVRYQVAHRAIYPVHQRVADRYRLGRVFLAGDAAHLNNPLGGLGLNGGIHDAVNLAGKLAPVIRQGKPVAELDGYERERRPVAIEYINQISIANKRNLETRDPVEQRRWRETMSRAAADPSLARQYLMRASMLASLEGTGAVN